MKKILEKKDANPSSEDSAGYTALHYAARAGHLNACQMLIDAGANINAVTRAGRATALHRATKQGHTQIISLLLEHGADPNITDADGKTPIFYSVSQSDNSVKTALHASPFEINELSTEK